MISIAWYRVFELAAHLHPAPLPDHIDGCFERDVGPFHVAMNVQKTERKDSSGSPVPPLHVLATHRGMPVILVGPRGGIDIGSGEADFIAAVEAEIRALGHEPEPVSR